MFSDSDYATINSLIFSFFNFIILSFFHSFIINDSY